MARILAGPEIDTAPALPKPAHMKARLLRLSIILVALAIEVAHAGELPDYVRFAEDGKSARLEAAIKTFTLPSGKTVDLIGVLHIADATYYQELNERFERYDSVLFELVGDPKGLTEAAPLTEAQRNLQSGGGMVSAIQQAAAKYLNLTFQLAAIDYTPKNMVHADATADEFAQMQKERGETTITLFTRAMQAQLSGQMDQTAMRELNTFALIRILMSPDSAAEFKKALAKAFDQMESMTALMEGKEGSAILGGRNAVVLKKIKEVLASKGQRRIAVFYGGAHMPGIESSLTKEMKAAASGEEWLPAWTMPN
jgi:hypothetical protein